MSSPAAGPSAGLAPVTRTLVLLVAAIGFLFDTYELLMFPVIGADAIGELVWVDPALEKPDADATPWQSQVGIAKGEGLRRGAAVTSAAVKDWTGRMLWIAALCGGVFGLLGGWLVDRLGRKTVMVGSIIIYSFSPVAAAYSTELWQLILFRCTTFIGVCVEMVAAVTWLAELFAVKRTRELAIGWTLACASLGGIFVTEVYSAIVEAAKTPGTLPAITFPAGHDPNNLAWRYTLLTGLVPGLLILLLMPFVPESRVWRERKRAGTLRRPSFGELFTPALLRTTLVTALLSACAYAAAFGALQMTPSQIAPGLPDMAPKTAEIASRGKDLAKLKAAVEKQSGEDAKAGKARIAESAKELNGLRDEVKARRGNIQRWQELGGLTGRILFALLLTTVPSRLLLRLFLVPGIVLFPLTYWVLREQDYALFSLAIFACGLLTVAQMSYMSEYLPKVFPVHLRGTGGGFATNVGARMLGTMAATLNTEFLANALTPGNEVPNPVKVATAAGWIGGVAFAVALVLSFLLPPPRTEEPTNPAPVGPDAG